MSDLTASEAMLLASRGELDARSLWFILTDVMSSVEQVRRRFEQVAARAPREAERVRDVFKRHRQVLDQACRHVSGPASRLESLSAQLSELNRELDDCLTEHREAAMVAMGPTRLPGVNAILQAIKANRSGAGLGALLAEERKRVERGLAAQHLPEEVADALGRMSEHLGEMLLLSDTPMEPRFRELAQSYYQTALTAQETFARAEAEARMESGPTPNPALNRLIHDVRAGLPADPQDVLGDIAGLRNQLASVARMLSSSQGVTAIAANLEEQFDRLEIAVETLCTQPAEWPRAVGEITAAFVGLSRSGKALALLGETEGKIPCVHCGQLNRSDFASCSRCGAVLPRVAQLREARVDIGENAGQGPPMTQNLKRMLDAIGAFENGAIPVHVFQDQVIWFRGLLARALELWPPGQQPPADYLEALQDVEAGLSFLEQAEGSGVMLDSGRALLLQGAARAHSIGA